MPKRSKVALYEQIRKAHDREGLSVRSLARRFGVHRRSVREALASAVPPERKHPEREAPVLGPWKPLTCSWLEEDQHLPRKQRATDCAPPRSRPASRRTEIAPNITSVTGGAKSKQRGGAIPA